MNPFRVVSEADLIAYLKNLSYEPTKETTATGTLWKSLTTDKHLLVPFPYEGMYPDFILKDLEAEIGKVAPTIQ